MKSIRPYTEAGRYLRLLRVCAADQWDQVQKEIQQLGETLKQHREYVRWAERSLNRWQTFAEACQHPLVSRLVQFLLQQKRMTFLVDLADALSDPHEHVLVSHAGDKAPETTEEIKKLITTLWGANIPIRTAQQKNLIKGVCLTYGHQTYDISYRRYRHHLVSHLRCATSLH